MPRVELPPDFLARMQHLLGAEYSSFLACYQEPPVAGLRVNTLKLSIEAWRALSPYTLSPVPWCPSGFTVDPSLDQSDLSSSPGKHPFHAAGLYYLQDPSAMAAAELLNPLPGERVLDLAAAPGGKTTHLAALMRGSGWLVANEIHPQRVWDLAENLERCGVCNATVLNESPSRLMQHFGTYFDRVLLDAPCSGEGMFRKSPTARQEWKPTLVQSCALRQGEILSSAARLVRPGGTLAYTTCTFAPEENEAQLDRFLTTHPEFSLVPLPARNNMRPARADWVEPLSAHPLEGALRLWPHHLRGEGHFVALLHKSPSSEEQANRLAPFKIRPPDASALKLFAAFWQEILTLPFPENLHQAGSYVYQLPRAMPALEGLRQIHPGWWLGVIKTGRFEPSHALALGLSVQSARRSINLAPDDPVVLAYLRGNSLSIPGEAGWVLICVGGYPIGWGKRSQGVVKNAYPHGLRWMS